MARRRVKSGVATVAAGFRGREAPSGGFRPVPHSVANVEVTDGSARALVRQLGGVEVRLLSRCSVSIARVT
jgi:hypothetical protein